MNNEQWMCPPTLTLLRDSLLYDLGPAVKSRDDREKYLHCLDNNFILCQNKEKDMKRFILGLCAVLFLGACEDRVAKDGDTVAIHFEGFLDGVQFEGGTGEDNLILGSGRFIPGFEEQLVGAKKGEVREVKLRFPDQYVPGLAGREVMFRVTVKGIR